MTTKVSPKMTLPSPPTMHFWRGTAGPRPRHTHRRTVLRRSGRNLSRRDHRSRRARLCYVQIDEVPLAMLCDPAVRETVTAAGEDPAALVGLYIDAINDAVASPPAGMHAGLHMCRGNFKGNGWRRAAMTTSPSASSPSRRRFLPARIRHAAGRRFRAAALSSREKGAVLGLVCSKTPTLEDVDRCATASTRRRITSL